MRMMAVDKQRFPIFKVMVLLGCAAALAFLLMSHGDDASSADFRDHAVRMMDPPHAPLPHVECQPCPGSLVCSYDQVLSSAFNGDECCAKQSCDKPGPAPELFHAVFHTTKGDMTVEFQRDLSPRGVDRIYELIQVGFFNDIAMFRTVRNFVSQFGLHGIPAVNQFWRARQIDDDAVKTSNIKGALTFAAAGELFFSPASLFVEFVREKHANDPALLQLERQHVS